MISVLHFSCPFAIISLINCEITKAKMTHFFRHRLFVKMLITLEDSIKNLFALEGYSAEQLVREFPSKGWNVGLVFNAKATGYYYYYYT